MDSFKMNALGCIAQIEIHKGIVEEYGWFLENYELIKDKKI